jgi:hypothetical protein
MDRIALAGLTGMLVEEALQGVNRSVKNIMTAKISLFI